MLSGSASKPPTGDNYLHEIKWDGIRAIISLEDGQVRIRTRNHNDVTKQFPELVQADKAFRATCGLFDAEIVCLDKLGKADFKKVIHRLMSNGETTIQKLSKTSPVYCYIFDCLYLDGRTLINEPLVKRREWMRDAIKPETPYRVSEAVDDGEALFEAAREHQLEGIISKERDGRYLPGKRSDLWLKIKVRNTRECYILGYNPGKGNRSQVFGGLHIAEKEGAEFIYRGKVGTGFDDNLIKEIYKQLKSLKEIKKPIPDKVMDEKISIWIEPVLIAEISFSMITKDNQFREPVFVRLRPDLG
jgi:DNA ligase D-like protein (predicted ligase)